MAENHAHQPHDGYPQPVAYDKDGNPLYSQPQFVHLSRAVEPMEQSISPEVARLHEESRKKYPQLNLSKGEFVLSAIRRHPIGLFKIWGIGLALIGAFLAMYYVLFAASGASSDIRGFSPVALLVVFIMALLVTFGTMAATYVYMANRFYLTNESVIQEIQDTLFSKHEQTVSLVNIEDASFKKNGIVQTLLNYGTIRLSTEGDETTYRFSYVSNPKRQIAILNNAVEAFKNGRPVGMPNDD